MGSARPPSKQAKPPRDAGTDQRVLRIGVILGGTIVEERLIRETVDVTIGQSSKNMFAIPIEGMPRAWSLFVVQDGRYYLQFSDAMDGRISDDAKVRTLDALKDKGAQRRSNAWVLPLSSTARGKISLGEMTLLFQFVSEPPLQPRPHLPASVRGTFADRLDPQLSVIMAISVLIHFAIGLYAYKRDRVIEKRTERVYNDTFQRPVIAATDISFEQPVEPTDTTAEKTDEPVKPDKPSQGNSEKAERTGKAKGGDGGRSSEEAIRMAEEEAIRLATALVSEDEDPFGVGGGSSGRDPKNDLDAAIKEVNRSGAKVEIGGGSSSRGTRGDADTRIGTGKGPDLGSAPGETATAGPKRTEKVPTSRIKVGSRQGLDNTTLTPDAVMRKINSVYMAGLKRCHNELLKRDPSAGGSVTLKFTVGESGRVVRASASGFDAGVDACIESRVKGWRFNAPKDEDGETTDAAFKITLALQGS